MQPVTGFFGKLTNYPDFVRFNSTCTEVSILDKWLQDGLYSARIKFPNWKELYHKSISHNFIIPFRETGRIMSGRMYFSSDSSGREFPFIIFNVLNGVNLPGKAYLYPYYVKNYHPLWNYDALNENLNFLTDKNPEADIQVSLNDYLEFIRTSQQNFWNFLFDGDENKKYKLISRFFLEQSRDTFLFELPEAGKDYELHLSSLLHLFLKSKHKITTQPVLFWTESAVSPNRIIISLNEINSISFMNLISPDLADIEVMTSEVDDENGNGATMYNQLLDNVEITLYELINIL